MSGWHVERADGRTAVVDEAGKAHVEVARFLERLAVRGLSPHTVEAYAFDLAIALRWMDEARVQLRDLRGDDLHKFIAWERGRASQPKSINRRLNTLRLFFRFVVGVDMSGGAVAAQPYRATRKDFELGLQRVARPSTKQLRVKESRTVVEPLTIDQVRELLASLARYRDLCIAHAMLLCGLRSTEVLLLRLGDIDFEDRRIRVRGKGNKERMVPLPSLLIDLLRRYLALERPQTSVDSCFVVLQGKRRGQPMTRAALRKVFRTRRWKRSSRNAGYRSPRSREGAGFHRAARADRSVGKLARTRDRRRLGGRVDETGDLVSGQVTAGGCSVRLGGDDAAVGDRGHEFVHPRSGWTISERRTARLAG